MIQDRAAVSIKLRITSTRYKYQIYNIIDCWLDIWYIPPCDSTTLCPAVSISLQQSFYHFLFTISCSCNQCQLWQSSWTGLPTSQACVAGASSTKKKTNPPAISTETEGFFGEKGTTSKGNFILQPLIFSICWFSEGVTTEVVASGKVMLHS